MKYLFQCGKKNEMAMIMQVHQLYLQEVMRVKNICDYWPTRK